MYKSRVLPNFYGVTDGRFCSYSGSSTFEGTHPKNWKQPAAWNYGMDRLDSQIAPPEPLGTQTFESTTLARPRFNECDNFRSRIVALPYSILYERYNYPLQAYWFWLYITPLFNRINVVGRFVPSWLQISDEAWNSYESTRRRAWWSMQPRYESEISALNFLWELKDFRSIARKFSKINLRNIARSLGKVRSGLRRELKRTRGRSVYKTLQESVDSITRLIAELHLTKTMAIDPLTKDCLIIMEEASVVIEKVQEQFKVRGFAPARSHYSEIVEQSDLLNISADSYYWRPFGLYSDVRFNATLEYTYSYKMRSAHDVIRKHYGLDVTGRTIWNAIPFSFLVDYFFEVDKAIRNMAKDPNVDMCTVQYCESLLNTTQQGYHLINDARIHDFYCPDLGIKSAEAIGSRPHLLSGVSVSHYRRRVTVPNKGSALPKLTLPSKGQVRNILALTRVLW